MSSETTIWSRVRAGEILENESIIDIHTHMGPWFNFHIAADPWAEGMIAAMDTCGIDLAITSPHVGLGPDAVWGNQQALDAIERFPARFAAYCTVNPNYPEAEMVEELEKCLQHRSFKGIKIHPDTHSYPATGPAYQPMWAFAHERELPVLVHTWESSPTCGPLLFEEIGKEFPRARILLGHAGATPKGVRESIQAARATSNLYLDLTKSLMHRGLLEVMVCEVGVERVLFGTDIPFMDGRSQIGYVAAARLSDEDKRRIFNLNARQLFDL